MFNASVPFNFTIKILKVVLVAWGNCERKATKQVRFLGKNINDANL